MDPPQPRRHNNQPQLQAGNVFSRNRRLRPPTPPRGTPLDDCVEWLGDSWMVLFLFETPTGFALFNYPGVKLFLPNAIEEIWQDFGKETSLLRDLVILKDFQTFDRTSRAIDIHTGVCSKLADMIKNCLKPKQTLAVGNSDYKKVIEAKMRIYCLCNDAVMEVMWGLNNVLTTILPNEISSVTTGNYPKICQGMQMVLDCYGIHLEPELVNKRITEMVWSIHQFDSAVNKYHHILHLWGQTILEVSQIDTRQWDFLKLATTLMLLSYPKQVKNLSLGDSPEMLTQDEAKKFIEDAPEYHGKLNKDTCRIMYKDIAKARSLRARALRLLGALINEARKVNTKLDCSEV